MVKFIFLGFSLLSSWSFPQSPCETDINKFCQHFIRGQKGIAKCLAQNYLNLSVECKDQREKLRYAMKQVKPICVEDIDKFCVDVVPGDDRIYYCMKENRKNLSLGCYKELEILEKKKEQQPLIESTATKNKNQINVPILGTKKSKK